jgi:hypothetical protein
MAAGMFANQVECPLQRFLQCGMPRGLNRKDILLTNVISDAGFFEQRKG